MSYCILLRIAHHGNTQKKYNYFNTFHHVILWTFQNLKRGVRKELQRRRCSEIKKLYLLSLIFLYSKEKRGACKELQRRLNAYILNRFIHFIKI